MGCAQAKARGGGAAAASRSAVTGCARRRDAAPAAQPRRALARDARRARAAGRIPRGGDASAIRRRRCQPPARPPTRGATSSSASPCARTVRLKLADDVKEPTTAGEWNAGAYHRVSDPQFQWGLRVLERLRLRGTERVLDAGCGTGRLTRVLAERVPKGVVVACDLSENMVRAAATTLDARPALPEHTAAIGVVRANLLALPWIHAFDIVFSTATFHWVPDHERLFTELRTVLIARGVLEAQCGGGPNLARVHARAKAVTSAARYRPYYEGWRDPWLFASAEETEERLRLAGFAEVRCWL